MSEQSEKKLTHTEKVDKMAFVLSTILEAIDNSLNAIATAENNTHQLGGGDSHLAQSRLSVGVHDLRENLGRLTHFTSPFDRFESNRSYDVSKDVVSDALRRVAKERAAARKAQTDDQS